MNGGHWTSGETAGGQRKTRPKRESAALSVRVEQGRIREVWALFHRPGGRKGNSRQVGRTVQIFVQSHEPVTEFRMRQGHAVTAGAIMGSPADSVLEIVTVVPCASRTLRKATAAR